MGCPALPVSLLFSESVILQELEVQADRLEAEIGAHWGLLRLQHLLRLLPELLHHQVLSEHAAGPLAERLLTNHHHHHPPNRYDHQGLSEVQLVFPTTLLNPA